MNQDYNNSNQPVKYKYSWIRIILYGIVGILIGSIIGIIIAVLLDVESDFWTAIIVLSFIGLSLFIFIKFALKLKDQIKIIDKTKFTGLSFWERIFVIVFSVMLPIISGFFLYYFWRKSHPLKAKQSLNIFWIVQLIGSIIYLLFKFR